MTDRTVRRTSVGSVLLVAAVAAVVSYYHLYELARIHGEGWRAGLIPLSIDGMLVAATLAIVSQRRQRRPAGWVPWLGLILGIGASLLGNIAAASPDVIARLIAGWPPAALAVAIETLVVILRNPLAAPKIRARSRELNAPHELPAKVEPAALKEKPAKTSRSAEPKRPMTNAERQKAYRDRQKQKSQERKEGDEDRVATASLA